VLSNLDIYITFEPKFYPNLVKPHGDFILCKITHCKRNIWAYFGFYVIFLKACLPFIIENINRSISTIYHLISIIYSGHKRNWCILSVFASVKSYTQQRSPVRGKGAPSASPLEPKRYQEYVVNVHICQQETDMIVMLWIYISIIMSVPCIITAICVCRPMLFRVIRLLQLACISIVISMARAWWHVVISWSDDETVYRSSLSLIFNEK